MVAFNFDPNEYADYANISTLRGRRGPFSDPEKSYEPWVGTPDPDSRWSPTFEDGEIELSPELDYDVDAFEPAVMVLPNLVGDKTVQFPGAPGTGKSVVVSACTCHAAMLINIPGLGRGPPRPRIVYLAERPEQIKDVLHGFKLAGLFGSLTNEQIEARFAIRKLPRKRPSEWRRFIAFLVKHYSESQRFKSGTLIVPPIIVIDTLASAVQIDQEDDNAELTDCLTEMEKGARVPGLAYDASLWITDHTRKDGWGTGRAAFGRGAGAKTAEADQVIAVHRHLLDDQITLLETVKLPRRGNVHVMMKFIFDSVEETGIEIFGEETGSTYWVPVKAEQYNREEYEAELDDAKGDRRREKADSNEERDKEHAKKAFRQHMQSAVNSGKRGLAFLKQGKTKGKQLDDYAAVRWRELYRKDDNSKSWAHVQSYIHQEFRGRDDGSAYWLFDAQGGP